MRSVITTLLMLALAGSALAQGDAQAGAAKAAVCGACHGADGNSANTEWPKIAGQHADYIVKQLRDYKDGGRRNAVMLGMATPLSDEDMVNLGAYFATQVPAGGLADATLVEEGERIYRGGDSGLGVPACMACHGPRGEGDPLGGFPRLAGQHAQYTEAQLKAFQSAVHSAESGAELGEGERDNDANGMMRATAQRMTPFQMRAVASYLAGLH